MLCVYERGMFLVFLPYHGTNWILWYQVHAKINHVDKESGWGFSGATCSSGVLTSGMTSCDQLCLLVAYQYCNHTGGQKSVSGESQMLLCSSEHQRPALVL